MAGKVRRRLTVLFILLGLGLAGQQAQAQENVLLTWDPDSTGQVTQYRVWYGSQSGIYTNTFTVANIDALEMAGLQQGVTYYFAIQCMDQQGDVSPLSNEASYTIPVQQSADLQMTYFPSSQALEMYGYVEPAGDWYVYSSTDMVHWVQAYYGGNSDWADYTVPVTNGPHMFFKVLSY